MNKEDKLYENYCNHHVANVDGNVSAQLELGRCNHEKIQVPEVVVMSQQAKIASVSIIGLVGLVVLLVGVFTDIYSFTVGLIIAIVCWVGSGILAKYWGVKKKKS